MQDPLSTLATPHEGPGWHDAEGREHRVRSLARRQGHHSMSSHVQILPLSRLDVSSSTTHSSGRPSCSRRTQIARHSLGVSNGAGRPSQSARQHAWRGTRLVMAMSPPGKSCRPDLTLANGFCGSRILSSCCQAFPLDVSETSTSPTEKHDNLVRAGQTQPNRTDRPRLPRTVTITYSPLKVSPRTCQEGSPGRGRFLPDASRGGGGTRRQVVSEEFTTYSRSIPRSGRAWWILANISVRVDCAHCLRWRERMRSDAGTEDPAILPLWLSGSSNLSSDGIRRLPVNILCSLMISFSHS